MKQFKIMLVTLFLTTTVLHAFEDPADFRGLKFNEDVRQQIPKCPNYMWLESRKTFEQTRSYKEKCWGLYPSNIFFLGNFGPIGDVEITVMSADQVDDKLSAILTKFSSVKFSIILAIFTERYGTPTTVMESTWLSKGGVSLPNTTINWKGKDIHIELIRLGPDLNTSTILISTKQWRDLELSESKNRIKDAAKGL
jgi:hypothetical protein